MDRRRFLLTSVAGALAVPLAVEAQQPDRVRVLGLLLPYIQSDPQAQARVSAFTAALQERGWTDGRNVRFEFRYTDGRPDRLPALAADLAERNVDAILTAGELSLLTPRVRRQRLFPSSWQPSAIR
jgi:putative ABC transport system substrate-binding protein